MKTRLREREVPLLNDMFLQLIEAHNKVETAIMMQSQLIHLADLRRQHEQGGEDEHDH